MNYCRLLRRIKLCPWLHVGRDLLPIGHTVRDCTRFFDAYIAQCMDTSRKQLRKHPHERLMAYFLLLPCRSVSWGRRSHVKLVWQVWRANRSSICAHHTRLGSTHRVSNRPFLTMGPSDIFAYFNDFLERVTCNFTLYRLRLSSMENVEVWKRNTRMAWWNRECFGQISASPIRSCAYVSDNQVWGALANFPSTNVDVYEDSEADCCRQCVGAAHWQLLLNVM